MKKFIEDNIGFLVGGLLSSMGIGLIVLSFKVELLSSPIIVFFAVIETLFGLFFICDEFGNHPDKSGRLKRLLSFLKPRSEDTIPVVTIVIGIFMIWLGLTQLDHDNLKTLLGAVAGSMIACGMMFLFGNRRD